MNVFKKKSLIFVLLLIVVLLIKWYSFNNQRVEEFYSTKFYPIMGSFFRLVFGWLPFSIGDILYGLVGIWIVIKLVSGAKKVIQKKITLKFLANKIVNGAFIALVVYITFNIFWGINYNRKGIEHQLNLAKDSISKEDIISLNKYLVKQVNETKLHLLLNKNSYPTNKVLFEKVENAYKKLNVAYPFLQYKPKSIKTSMWGWLGNYLGFTGYYNPFTGEAQVNTTVPKFLQPYTTCHEVAHQLGYAKENEANFVGFLAGLHSNDTLLLYSTYLDMFLYSNRNLLMIDFKKGDSIKNQLISFVKSDLKELIKFNANHKSFMEPIVKWGYGYYLKQNNQPQGMLSYDAVTSFLVAYYKKYGY